MREAWRDLSELPGEDLTTSALPEVAGWISIYEELASVLRSVISRANGSPDSADLRRNLAWIDDRLAVWRDRHAELADVLRVGPAARGGPPARFPPPPPQTAIHEQAARHTRLAEFEALRRPGPDLHHAAAKQVA